MDEYSPQDIAIFRAGLHLFVISGLFVSLFVGLGIIIAVTKENWTLLAVAGGVMVILFLLLRVLRLEIRPNEFIYRNLSGKRTVSFGDVEKAYFQTIRADVAPQGVAAFWIQLRNGKRLKVNLRTFPIRAAALLFSALELYGIPIEVPDTSAAQRMAHQIREEQARMRS